MSSMTTLSPSRHGNASATTLTHHDVFGRNAISSAAAPMKRAAFARAVSIVS